MAWLRGAGRPNLQHRRPRLHGPTSCGLEASGRDGAWLDLTPRTATGTAAYAPSELQGRHSCVGRTTKYLGADGNARAVKNGLKSKENHGFLAERYSNRGPQRNSQQKGCDESRRRPWERPAWLVALMPHNRLDPHWMPGAADSEGASLTKPERIMTFVYEAEWKNSSATAKTPSRNRGRSETLQRTPWPACPPGTCAVGREARSSSSSWEDGHVSARSGIPPATPIRHELCLIP